MMKKKMRTNLRNHLKSKCNRCNGKSENERKSEESLDVTDGDQYAMMKVRNHLISRTATRPLPDPSSVSTLYGAQPSLVWASRNQNGKRVKTLGFRLYFEEKWEWWGKGEIWQPGDGKCEEDRQQQPHKACRVQHWERRTRNTRTPSAPHFLSSPCSRNSLSSVHGQLACFACLPFLWLEIIVHIIQINISWLTFDIGHELIEGRATGFTMVDNMKQIWHLFTTSEDRTQRFTTATRVLLLSLSFSLAVVPVWGLSRL